MSFPPRVDTDITTAKAETIGEYWRERAVQHTQDSYAGVPLSKFPEDLRTYEHLLWDQQPDVVVEIGTQHGASTLWFRDRLEAQRRYRPGAPSPKIVAVDIDTAATEANLDRVDPSWRESITLIQGDVCSDELAQAVKSAVPDGANTFVIEDSAHVYDTTLAALKLYSDLVPIDGYFIVEDGCVDVEPLRIADDWPRGVLPAVDEWLQSEQGGAFERRRDLEFYGITCHPKGFLKRVR